MMWCLFACTVCVCVWAGGGRACSAVDIIWMSDKTFQSLEALHDGEHEKQRRHFLYFLLHQVPVSSNFSILTRKLACQVIHLDFCMLTVVCLVLF